DNPYAYLSLTVLQSLVISAMVFPVCALTRRWFGTVPAKIVIWFCALGPLYLWFPARIHHTAFVMGVHPWLLLGWLQLVEDPTAGRGGPADRPPPQAAVGAGRGGCGGERGRRANRPRRPRTAGGAAGVLSDRRLAPREEPRGASCR